MSWEGGADTGKAEGREEERSMREAKEAEEAMPRHCVAGCTSVNMG